MTGKRRIVLSSVSLMMAIAGSFAGACGGGSGDATSAGPRGGFGGSKGGVANGGAAGRFAAGGATGQDNRPPEQEVESSFEVPVATGRFVWVANPTSGRVAYIDAATLAVKTAEAGNAPTVLAVIPGVADEVIVLNVLSHDATVMQATAAGQLTRTMVVGVAPLANAWAISPDGHFALAWTNTRIALADPARQKSLEGFQDLTAIDLSARPPTATTLAVGYRPVSIAFAADGTEAYVVTGDGISVLGLPAAGGSVHIVRDIALTDDPTDAADTRDVSVTLAGRAVVRREGSPAVGIVDLQTGVIGTVTLSGPVTDVDVTPDGTRAIAVVRDRSEIAILPLASAVANPDTILREIIEGEVIGSAVLTADAAQAVLFSNATEAERLTVVDLVTGSYRIVRVHAPVLAVVPTPDGKYAVVLHRAAAATPGAGGAGGATTVTVSWPSNAFSVIPLDGSRSGRIQETTAPPNAVALAPGSDRALVTVRNDKGAVFGAYVVGIPALDVMPIVLGSPPIATGVAQAANRGYVAQSHSEGRITFIPFEGGPPKTITGFDLGARVVDGVSP